MESVKASRKSRRKRGYSVLNSRRNLCRKPCEFQKNDVIFARKISDYHKKARKKTSFSPSETAVNSAADLL
jgi:hypothetical protein